MIKYVRFFSLFDFSAHADLRLDNISKIFLYVGSQVILDLLNIKIFIKVMSN